MNRKTRSLKIGASTVMEFFGNALPLIYKKFLNILKRIYIDKAIVIHIIKAENAHSVAPIMAHDNL